MQLRAQFQGDYLPKVPTVPQKELEKYEALMILEGVPKDELNQIEEKDLVGIEVEVEHMIQPQLLAKYRGNIWNIDHDGSLKVQGVEYQSKPIPGNYVPSILYAFYRGLFHSNPMAQFTERCSIHVHVDVGDLEPEQLAVNLLIYSTVEWLLFKFAEKNRRVSNFCVPVNDTHSYYTAIKRFIRDYERGLTWDGVSSLAIGSGGKYAALGLFRLTDLCTVEYRHMHGTSDIQHLLFWISLALKIKTAAKKITLSKLIKMLTSINTTSQYHSYLTTIFGSKAIANRLLPTSNIFPEISSAISTTKQVFVSEVTPTVKGLIDSPLGDLISERGL